MWVGWSSSIWIIRESLESSLEQLCIRRPCIPVSLSTTQWCFYYVHSSSGLFRSCGFLGFVMGKTKLAAWPAHTNSMLELCAVEIAEPISLELNFDIQAVKFYTDGKTVLDYIHNTSKLNCLGPWSCISQTRRNKIFCSWDNEHLWDTSHHLLKASGEHLSSHHFECFSSWWLMIYMITRIHLARAFSKAQNLNSEDE